MLGLSGLLLSLLLAIPAPAQESVPLEITDFSGGMNTYSRGPLLKDNEAQLAENVVLDQNQSLTRRKGFSKLNNTAIGDGSVDVNAVFPLERSNGTRYCLSYTGTTGYYSIDGCQTNTIYISTLAATDVSCDNLQDRSYCVNNSFEWYFDGRATATNASSAFPGDPKFIRVFRNRCFIAGTTANPSRVYYSALGDCMSWTATDFFDVFPEDGDVITGIGEPLYDMLPIYKGRSTVALKGATPQTWQLTTISRNIGAKNHRSIANLNSVQLFDSIGPYGGAPGIYGFDGVTIKEASRNIRAEIEDLDTFRSANGRRTVDTQDDFQAGTFDPYTMSATREIGFMQSSYTAFTDTLGADFAKGTLVNTSTTAYPGRLVLCQDSSGTFVNAGAEQQSTTINWLTNTMSVSDPAVNTFCSGFYGSGYGWTAGESMECRPAYGIPAYVTINVTDENQNIVLSQQLEVTASMSTGEFTIDTSTLPYARIALYNTVGSKSQRSKPFIRPQSLKVRYTDGVSGLSNLCAPCFDIDESSQTLAGTWTRIYDTAISTPVFGLFDATITSGTVSNTSTGTLTFTVQASSTEAGPYSAVATPTLGAKINAPNLRFLKVSGRFAVAASTEIPPSMADMNVAAASTGTWYSPELFLSNSIADDGLTLFQTAQTVSGSQASLAYAIRIATFAGGTATRPWTVITPGTDITLSTGAYAQVMSTATVAVATETAKIDSISISWLEGTVAKSATGKVFDNRYHYGAQSNGGLRNDTIWVLDENGAWVRWTGLRPRFLNVVNQRFIMADSSTTAGGFLHRLYDTEADNGAAIRARWISKDFSFGKIGNIKAIDRIKLVHQASPADLSVTVGADTGLQRQSFTVDLSTGADFRVTDLVVEPNINGNTLRLEFENNAASQPWEILGYQLYFRDLGMSP